MSNDDYQVGMKGSIGARITKSGQDFIQKKLENHMAKGGVLGQELNSVFAKRAGMPGDEMTADEKFKMQQAAEDAAPRSAPRIQDANAGAESALMQLAKERGVNASDEGMKSPMDNFSAGERRVGAEEMAPVAPQMAAKLGGSGALQKRALNKKAETYSAVEPGTSSDQGPGY